MYRRYLETHAPGLRIFYAENPGIYRFAFVGDIGVKQVSCVVILILCLLRAFAQEPDANAIVHDWFEHNPRAEVYGEIEKDLAAIIERAQAASLPAELFLEILDEAATKKVQSGSLLETLEARLTEFITIRTILKNVQSCLGKKPAFDDFSSAATLKKYSLFFRQGLSEKIMKSVLDEACMLRKDYDGAINVLKTLAAIPSRDELSEEELVSLARAILGSSLSPTSYTALSALYIKGKLKNLTTHAITEIFIRVLEEGKGLVRIEQELNRRSGQ